MSVKQPPLMYSITNYITTLRTLSIIAPKEFLNRNNKTYPHLVVHQECIVITDNIRVDRRLHDTDFSNKQFRILFLQVHLLNCYLISSLGVSCKEHFASSAFSDLFRI